MSLRFAVCPRIADEVLAQMTGAALGKEKGVSGTLISRKILQNTVGGRFGDAILLRFYLMIMKTDVVEQLYLRTSRNEGETVLSERNFSR